MKFYICILILLFSFIYNTANADYITTHTFVVDSDTTVTIVVSGTLSASIDGTSGALSTPLELNFNITTNEDLDNVRMRAYVLDSASVKENALCCSNTSEVTSAPIHLILGDYTTGHEPDSSSISDCRSASSTALNNPDSIAYPGTVSINNGGTVQYDNSQGYFNCNIKSGVSDLNLALTTMPKAGTYDSDTGLDEPDNFEAEIYLDNIPE